MTRTLPLDGRAVTIRGARATDQTSIVRLMRGEPVRPFGLRWDNFVVAELGGKLIGAAQLRVHKDGARELGSLVVAPDCRNRGVASGLITALLGREVGDVHMITRRAYAAHYARWGFRAMRSTYAPASLRWQYLLGRVGGWIMSHIERRKPHPLVILACRRAPAR